MAARVTSEQESFGGGESISGSHWFAVYTKAREEHTALLNLERQSFECYLPVIEGRRQCRPAYQATHATPLFPRYLFLNAVPEVQNLATVRSTRGVVGLVRAGFELVRVSSAIIAGIKSRMNPETGLITLDPDSPATGDTVRVSGGPFAALQGILTEHRGQTRSLMLVEILGREVAVDINTRLLQRAG